MATVIKAHETPPRLARRLEAVTVSDHIGEARLVLKRSREEARRLLQEAQTKAASLRGKAEERGFEAGFRRGYEAGAQAGRDEAFEVSRKEFGEQQSQLIEALRSVIADFEQRKRDLFIAAEVDVVRFAMDVAEKVTKQIGKLHSESAAGNLEEALHLVETKTNLQVHLHPDDVATVQEFVQTLDEDFHRAQNLHLVADDTVTPGGCRVTGPDLEVDATLDTQLDQIAVLMSKPAEDRA